jgi:hypothetical protein
MHNTNLTLSQLVICISRIKKITAQDPNTEDFHKSFQIKRTRLCFLILQTIESSTYAKDRYVTLKLDTIYTELANAHGA